MSDFVLSLGGVGFRSFEIPSTIAGGNGQLLQVKQYAGGERTIDSLGPTPAPIRWEGVFLGADAEARWQQLAALVNGEPVELTWSSVSFLVVIKEFPWEYRKFWEIGYSITLEVAEDQTNSPADEDEDPETAIQSDIDDTANFSSAIGDTGLSALTDQLLSAARSVPAITSASSSFLSGFSGQIGSTLSYVTGMVSNSDDVIDALPQIAGGGDPDALADHLQAFADSSDTLATAFALKNTLGRLQKNVAAITG